MPGIWHLPISGFSGLWEGTRGVSGSLLFCFRRVLSFVLARFLPLVLWVVLY